MSCCSSAQTASSCENSWPIVWLRRPHNGTSPVGQVRFRISVDGHTRTIVQARKRRISLLPHRTPETANAPSWRSALETRRALTVSASRNCHHMRASDDGLCVSLSCRNRGTRTLGRLVSLPRRANGRSAFRCYGAIARNGNQPASGPPHAGWPCWRRHCRVLTGRCRGSAAFDALTNTRSQLPRGPASVERAMRLPGRCPEQMRARLLHRRTGRSARTRALGMLRQRLLLRRLLR